MEIRDLRAFTAAAEELHFARAADRLRLSASSMSEIIRRLEGELGTPLFIRSTRRVELTDAGALLHARAQDIIDRVEQATEAVRAVGQGITGEIVVGVTPPAAPVLAPHLADLFCAAHPGVTVRIERLWLPNLAPALAERVIDVALTCGGLDSAGARIATAVIGSEPVLVGLRADDPLAESATVALSDLAGRPFGLASRHLFPAWHDAQRAVLAAAQITPPVRELAETDLQARRWAGQADVDWVMLIGSLLAGQENTAVRPADPPYAVPFTISWRASVAASALSRRFVDASLAATLPSGWHAHPGP